MDAPRFAQLADAYGGDLARWPGDERDAARALLEASAEARIALAAAQALDAGLALPAPVAPGAALREALLQLRLKPLPQGDLQRRARGWSRLKPLLQGRRNPGRGHAALPSAVAGWREAWSWRLALPALAVSLTLGIGLGFAIAPAAQADDGDEDVLALAQLDDDYTEFTEP